jgi:hypothetical protein
MNLRTLIRKWLGIENVLVKLISISIEQQMLHTELRRVHMNIITHHDALGRIIAKLDPLYGVDEQDPARRAESDRISRQAMERLEAEAKARAPYNQ